MADDELDPRVRSAETKKQRTRQKLIHAADMVMRDEGWNATVDAIAEEAGVSTPTFYNFYKSRNLLCMDAFVELVISQLRTVAAEHLPIEATMRMVWNLCHGRENLVRAALVGRLEQGEPYGHGEGLRYELIPAIGGGGHMLVVEAIKPFDLVDQLAEIIWYPPTVPGDLFFGEPMAIAALKAATLKLLDSIAMKQALMFSKLAEVIEASNQGIVKN